ncbi:MAG: hypothetical protein U1E65_32525 [Myxococcota bacterium]
MNLISKTLLSLALVVPAVGCGGGMSKQDAMTGWAAANVALSQAFAQAQTMGGGLHNDATATLNFTYNCPGGGGTIAITGSADTSTPGMESVDVTEKATGCKSNNITLDGTMSYKTVVNGSAVNFKWTGSLTFSGQVSGTCDIDVTVNSSGTGGSVTGTICGYSLSAAG